MNESPRPFHVLEDAAKAAAPGPVELAAGSLLNMELSNLAFNERVLDMAEDPAIPLLERVRFVSIFGSNLDEFFMTRVAGFKRQVALQNPKPTLDGLSPWEQLEVIDRRTRELFDRVYLRIVPNLLDELATARVELLRWADLREDEQLYLRANYTTQLDPVLPPVYVRPGGPFPHVRNLRPAFLVSVAGPAEPGLDHHAILELPGDVPRLLPLPGGRRFVPLEDVVRADLDRLVPGADPVHAHLFRVARSGNLSLDAETSEDIVAAVARNLARRPYQPVVRIEVEEAMPEPTRHYLFEELRKEAEGRESHLAITDLFPVAGPIDLARLRLIAELPIDELKYPRRRRYAPLRKDVSTFDQIRQRDILLRFPRHSFERTVERFIREATNDPAVESICITLYRTSRASRIVRLLRRAHSNGKAVTTLIEVKASFDEQRNIEWARMLESAGIRVLYGPPSLKVHAKIASVVRKEGEGRALYSYIGTGNLNAATAAAYTDLGLITADRAIGLELQQLFGAMAGNLEPKPFQRLVVAPFNMRSRILELIAREIENARSGRRARITAKLNGLADKEMIGALYRANAAGVDVDLIVRGICALRPGVPNLSERIRVVALAGRYLEHSRILRFENDGAPEFFIGSADWRGRNLSRRVEVATPVLDPIHQQRLESILLEDLNCPDAWDLHPDGRYVRRSPASSPEHAGPGTSALARAR